MKHFKKEADQQARRRTRSAIAPARISSVLGSPGLKMSKYNVLLHTGCPKKNAT